MTEEETKKTEKDVNKEDKKHKIIKSILWTLIIVLTLGVAAFVILSILITDRNKNPYKDNGITNQQIINKEFVQGLSQINDNFEFKLTYDDVNTMLANSLEVEEVSEYIKSAYYEVKDNTHKWCFDLKVPVFTTRLVINTHIGLVENSYVFAIDSMTIGKLNAWSFLQEGEYISNDVFNTLFEHADLPITAHLENGYFTYEPLKFIDIFELGDATKELFGKLNTSNRLSINPGSFGFKLNLDGIKVNEPDEITGAYNLPQELGTIVGNDEIYNTLTTGSETPILEVSEENFSKWIKDCCTKDLTVELIESDLINTKITANIKKIEVKFTNNEFVLYWTLKLGNIYFEVSESLGLGSDVLGFKVMFFRPVNESAIQKTLIEDFIKEITKTEFVTYQDSNKSLVFDFSSITTTANIEMFTNKRLNIVNNKFTFFLKKLGL